MTQDSFQAPAGTPTFRKKEDVGDLFLTKKGSTKTLFRSFFLLFSLEEEVVVRNAVIKVLLIDFFLPLTFRFPRRRLGTSSVCRSICSHLPSSLVSSS